MAGDAINNTHKGDIAGTTTTSQRALYNSSMKQRVRVSQEYKSTEDTVLDLTTTVVKQLDSKVNIIHIFLDSYLKRLILCLSRHC